MANASVAQGFVMLQSTMSRPALGSTRTAAPAATAASPVNKREAINSLTAAQSRILRSNAEADLPATTGCNSTMTSELNKVLAQLPVRDIS